MKVEHRKGSDERQILTGMIVNSQVLGRIAAKYEDKMFASTWANLVGSWCVKYYQKYNKAPKKHIRSVYEKWAERSEDRSTVDIVTKFLESLSKEYDENRKISVDYTIDQAGRYFNKVKLARLKEQLEENLENGQVEKAEEVLDAHRRVEMGVEELSNPYQELDVHKRTFEKTSEPLLTYPGALKNFFGDRLCRDGFIVFQAPSKRKKSFWLLDIVHRGLRNRLNVLYLQVGDMSEDQVTRRIEARLCLRPWKVCKYRYPISLTPSDGKDPRVKRRLRKTRKELSLGDIQLAQRKFRDLHLRSDRKFLNMWCTPSLSMSDIRTRIQRLKDYDNWVPDIVVLDYVDLLELPRMVREKRDQIIYNWRQLRKLSLELHCLVVSATQANAKAHKRDIQDRTSWSDNQLKMAEVTGLIGINQLGYHQERKELMRLNWIVVREGTQPPPVWTAGCLAISNPAVLSCK